MSKKIFIDLGTHNCQGLFHFVYNELKIDNKWELHTFEPNSLINVNACVAQFKDISITIHRKAVWIRDGFVTFKQYGGDGTSQGSLIADTNGDLLYNDYYDKIIVECIDFYEFIKNLGNDNEIYIKMDIEWAEYAIIEDMLNRGWPKNIKYMWIEWHGMNNDIFIEKSKALTEQIKIKGVDVKTWF